MFKLNKIYLLILIPFFLLGCKKSNFVIYENPDGICAFMIDGKFEVWCHQSKPLYNDFTNTDSIDIYNNDIYFLKKEIKENNYHYDSLYVANYIDLSDDWLKNIVLYNAKIFQNEWIVAVYHPFKLKGTYTFTILPEEEKIFNSLLFLHNKNVLEVYPEKKYIDSLNIAGYQRNHDFYSCIFNKGLEKSIYSIYPYMPKNSFRLYQITSIIIYNHIQKKQSDTSFIGVLDVRKRFEQMSKKKTFTDNLIVYDIDSMAKFIDNLYLK